MHTIVPLYNLIQYISWYYKVSKKNKGISFQTRMTTFIKTKFKISDDHTNMDKYKVAANIMLYQN